MLAALPITLLPREVALAERVGTALEDACVCARVCKTIMLEAVNINA